MKPRQAAALAPILCLMLVASSACKFLPESSFDLAPDSRLPKWFTIPKGMSRTDVKVTEDDYITSAGRSSVFTLWDKSGRKLAQADALTPGLEPHTLSDHRTPEGGFTAESYPLYEINTANGITEVTEYKQMEPVFYVNDDPVVRAAIRLQSTSKGPVK